MSDLTHNVYFDGAVQSIGFERLGRKMTIGTMVAGEYRFGTDAPERMTVTTGELRVRLAGGQWKTYPAGTQFEVPGSSSFDVAADASAAYLCEFL